MINGYMSGKSIVLISKESELVDIRTFNKVSSFTDMKLSLFVIHFIPLGQ